MRLSVDNGHYTPQIDVVPFSRALCVPRQWFDKPEVRRLAPEYRRLRYPCSPLWSFPHNFQAQPREQPIVSGKDPILLPSYRMLPLWTVCIPRLFASRCSKRHDGYKDRHVLSKNGPLLCPRTPCGQQTCAHCATSTRRQRPPLQDPDFSLNSTDESMPTDYATR